MKSYLNAKLILFKEILKRKSTIISDREIKPFNLLKKISKKKNLKILDITKNFNKINNLPISFDSNYKN